jgi:hypothetical protein
MPPILPAWLGAHQAPVLAIAVSLALVLTGRLPRAGWAAGAAAGAGALLGWGARLGGPRPWRLVFAPESTPQHLLLVAAVILGAGLLATKVRSRGLAAASAVLAGWWVALSPAAGVQFWRAWLAIAVLPILLLRVAADTKRLAAAPLALAAGLLATGAPSPWPDVGLVAAAAALPLLAAEGAMAPLPLALLGVTTAAAADLGAGRLPRAGFGPVDLACLLALAAPLAVAPAARRLGRAAPAAPAAVAVIAGVLAWIGRLALAHR